jgi:hypothetical protein
LNASFPAGTTPFPSDVPDNIRILMMVKQRLRLAQNVIKEILVKA